MCGEGGLALNGQWAVWNIFGCVRGILSNLEFISPPPP